VIEMNEDQQTALAYLQDRAKAFHGRAAIVGKGPSFAEFDDSHRASRFVVGLNEAALHTACHASFIIDEDILESCGAALAARPLEALMTPRVLHAKTASVGGLVVYGPTGRDARAAPWRAAFGPRHRCFNLSTAEPAPDLGPGMQAFNFSAPTLAHLLARAGFNDILLAGIDGGTSYSADFKALEYKKLRSVQSDFDAQFAELRLARDRYGVKFRSIRCDESWVLIGADTEQCLATEVLKWSIESRTFLSVRYCDPNSASRALYADGTAGTPFTFQRIFLPQLASHSGRGVYFDSDMLVFKDVYELLNRDMGEHVLLGCAPTPGRRMQYSVFLVDNRRANWDAELLLRSYLAGELSYDSLMRQFCFAQPKASTLPMEWNSLETFSPGKTANIHYTDMGTQPWLSVYNPNADVWCEALFQALRARAEVRHAYERSLDQGWIRPSLRWQVENEKADPWSLPRHVKQLDRDWLPPHIRLRTPAAPAATQLLKWRVASHIRRVMQSRSYVRLMRAGHALRKVF
jgi:hypothetical protein